jgi:hypothetical protein
LSVGIARADQENVMTTEKTPTVRALQNFGETLGETWAGPAAASPGEARAGAARPMPGKGKPARPRAKPREKVPRLTATEQRLGRHLVVALGAVIIIMLGVSLEHLASGIREITHSTVWSAWALAIAIDVGMVASEIALIVLATFPNIRVAGYAHRYVASTIVISIALNVWAFWPPEDDATLIGQVLAVILGAGIPLGVYHLTRVAGRLWLATSNRIAPA